MGYIFSRFQEDKWVLLSMEDQDSACNKDLSVTSHLWMSGYHLPNSRSTGIKSEQVEIMISNLIGPEKYTTRKNVKEYRLQI